MLGRQQIAGIPTAISEIFKNAYDAYATEVRGDYFPAQRVLVIRDNGTGMSREEFTTRWLTIGTESKSTGSALPPLHRPERLSVRRQMGEKGIGRLAIASVGPQLIVVSRGTSSGGDSLDSMVVSFVQWSMFEIPGITLDEVAVPIRVVNDEEELTRSLIDGMVQEVKEALDALGSRVPSDTSNRIRHELASLDIEIGAYLRVNGPNVFEGSGTAFVVCPVHADVDVAMQVRDTKPDEFSVSDFQRFLLGFTNTITPGKQTPEFSTAFVVHGPTGTTNLIDESTYFWEQRDFELTDHMVEGRFDEFGTFAGTVSIYQQEALHFEQEWRGSGGKQTACGPFRIKFGYVQGKATESRLDATEFATMTARLEKIGGLYVYRDGIRVLPYGNADVDYLEIEKRRTLNAATYYFSYRRMFGAIEIDSDSNRSLQEKAGREGFRENNAYRDFKEILKSFLVQLAAGYFSAGGGPSQEWKVRRQQLSAESKRRREEDQRREELAKKLQDRTRFIESGAVSKEIELALSRTQQAVRQAQSGAIATDAVAIEAGATTALDKIGEKLQLQRPSGLAFTLELDRDWNSYEKLRDGAEQLLGLAFARLDSELAPIRADNTEFVDLDRARSARLDRNIRSHSDRQHALASEISRRASEIAQETSDAAHREIESLDRELAELVKPKGGFGLVEVHEIEARIGSVVAKHAAVLETLRGRLDAQSSDNTAIGGTVELEERILDLEEQVESNLELLQLGQAVQIVSHEFDSSIRSVRANLKQLDPWARSTPRLQPLVKALRASFAHLDGYLRLFTPLQRRLYKEASRISGSEIETFLRGVFEERLKRHGVELQASPKFREYALTGYPSTFYPVFVNLVDNAIYWLVESSSPRTVRLDVDGKSLVVKDSGPGIRPADSDYIFERGFSRRRGGRGLGLTLARELLARDSWLLSLMPTASGAEFRVSPITDGEGE